MLCHLFENSALRYLMTLHQPKQLYSGEIRMIRLVFLSSILLSTLCLHCFICKSFCHSNCPFWRRALTEFSTYFWVDLKCATFTHRRWKTTTKSSSKSLMSTTLPLLLTSGCFLRRSQPTCEKKKPRFALWGSASVSENLWCTLWSRAHS
jgi:hypothetical protein